MSSHDQGKARESRRLERGARGVQRVLKASPSAHNPLGIAKGSYRAPKWKSGVSKGKQAPATIFHKLVQLSILRIQRRAGVRVKSFTLRLRPDEF